MDDEPDITQLLLRWSEGESAAFDKLLPQLYDRLRAMAHHRLRTERSDHTFNTTALVHEAYMKLVDVRGVEWKDRVHFLAVASRVMRQILVDYARRRRALKRGGPADALPLNEELVPDEQVGSVLELDDALERMAVRHERQSRALELYSFGGLTLEEVGAALDVSAATAMRDVRFAKAWLKSEWTRTSDVA